jgi:hypothetical protein
MRFISNKKIFVVLFIFTTTIILNCIENNNDTVNIRKLFFNNEKRWEKFSGKKTFYKNNIAFICLKEPPDSIDKLTFSNEILLKITNNPDKNIILKNYLLDSDEKFYSIKTTLNILEKKKIIDFFTSIGFTKQDYFLVFYNSDPELEKKYKPMDPDLKETFTFGKITYRFNYLQELIESKIYFQENNNSFLYFNRFTPNKFDVFLFGKNIKKGLPYFFNIDSLKILPLKSILSLVDINRIQDETLVDKNDRKLKELFIEKIIIPSTKYDYEDDGAINEFGEFVYIMNGQEQKNKKGLNCSGFVKDVIDNYIRLRNKDFKWLSIDELKSKREEERKKIPYTFFEETNDPFFGLEWSKNLIDKVNEHYDYINIKADILNSDEYSELFDSSGYYVSDMKEILFRDQKKESNYFYILAFNRLKKTTPVMPEFYHLSIVVPYFENNHFYLRSFESTKETDFTKMLNNHIGEKVAIIRIPIPITELFKE